MAMGDQIRISVRDLVEFIFREGDIDTRSGGAPEEAMLEGARMHRKIQRQAGADYMAEVPLSILYSTGKVDVLLEGRADGVFLSDPETVRRQAAAAYTKDAHDKDADEGAPTEKLQNAKSAEKQRDAKQAEKRRDAKSATKRRPTQIAGQLSLFSGMYELAAGVDDSIADDRTTDVRTSDDGIAYDQTTDDQTTDSRTTDVRTTDVRTADKSDHIANAHDADDISGEAGTFSADAASTADHTDEFSDEEVWAIDEIKTTYHSLRKMEGPVPVHAAQAMCYAYIYLIRNGLDRIRVRMTYCHLVTEKTRMFWKEFSKDEITAWFEAAMREYERWALLQLEIRHRCVQSTRALEFPFPYREGQRDLVVHVYHTICHGRKLFLEAPTGTGKTICSVFPSVKAMGEGHADKLFYLTSKTVTGTVAIDTFALLRSKGLHLTSVQLTSKERICLLEKPACDPESCPRARGHFDRVNDALYDMLSSEENIDRAAVTAYASKYCVCPFELSLDAALFADAIVGDYNYLFDPHARLRRFFAGAKPAERYLFLIDEAHNLVDRARDMYSAVLTKSACRSLRKVVRTRYPALYKSLGQLVKELGSIAQEGGGPVTDSFGGENAFYAEEIAVGRVTDKARIVYMDMQEILSSLQKGAGKARLETFAGVREDFLSYYFELSHFLTMYDESEDGYVAYVTAGRSTAPAGSPGSEDTYRRQTAPAGFPTNEEAYRRQTAPAGGQRSEEPYRRQTAPENAVKGSVSLYLRCVDPSAKLAECMEKGVSTILFSATLQPVQYYKRLLGGTPEDYEVSAKSAFDPERQGVFIATGVTSRYRDRTASQFIQIAEGIHSAVSQRHGNYLVFFPSYRFMQQVLDNYLPRFPEDADTAYLIQSARMNEDERRAFLDAFEQVSDEHSQVGFCVLGGIFSEGIDLRMDRLIGVLVVGTGLPQVCAEREVLRQYFDMRGDSGFDYAYRFPGMNKVLQAAGRVIRTTEDVGIIVLMDERYTAHVYRRLFPYGWRDVNCLPIDQIGDKISRFWDEWL